MDLVPKRLPPPPELATLPARLRYARERSQMTQTALAAKAQVALPQISRLEAGERVSGIEAATIIRLARALGAPVGWLAADEGELGQIPVFHEGRDKRRKPRRE
jgi:transcriptional regulator with XRE-family HTH domain